MRTELILIPVMTLCGLTPAPAQTKRTLYLFNGPLPSPNGGVTIGPGGVLYGTTYNGGAGGMGSVFSLTPPTSAGGKWTETELYAFASGGPSGPLSGVVIGNGGVLYGTSYAGGAMDAGTVFSLTPPASPGGAWTEAVLHSFAIDSSSDGETPWAGLAIGTNGELLGTTLYGGYGSGTVYQLTPPSTPGGTWTETILYSFNPGYGGVTANTPYSGVLVGKGGRLYSSTLQGGGSGYAGTVYSLTPTGGSGPWNLLALHEFGSTGDGNAPYGNLVMDRNGILYGTTLYGGSSTACPNGCGTVFSVNPNPPYYTETVLYSFTGGSGGSSPQGKLAIGAGGVLYGVTSGGGSPSGGTLFSLTPPATKGGAWTWQLLYSFNGMTNGDWPSPLAVGKSGALFGTTYGGPSTVFELIP